MLLLKLGSDLPNLVKKFQSVLKISTKCRLNFHEVEYFHEVECTGGWREGGGGGGGGLGWEDCVSWIWLTLVTSYKLGS